MRKILLVLALLVIGAAGWFTYSISRQPQTSGKTSSATPLPSPSPTTPCNKNDSTEAENGVFCSKEIGIKLTVPSIFSGKITRTNNYLITQGGLDPSTATNSGTSEAVYTAKLSGNDNFTLSIAKEPLRSGYLDAYHLLQRTYFNQDTRNLQLRDGKIIPAFNISNTKVFSGTSGDAGVTINSYVCVVNNKIVIIKLRHEAYMGPTKNDPATIDETKVFAELDRAIKELQVLD